MSATELRSLLEGMEAFEASESLPNTGTGTRREGEGFEGLAREMWRAFAREFASVPGCEQSAVRLGSRQWACLKLGTRSVYLPVGGDFASVVVPAPRESWFEVEFSVGDIVRGFAPMDEVVARFSPATGPYARDEYPKMFEGLKTKFDDTLVLVDGGVIVEKYLLEYKSAKSSKQRQIDGNAHERLSFQAM